jgi:predicted nuclease with TOPRIM domain
MTHHIEEKIETTKAELESVIKEYNNLVEKQNELKSKAIELQGALKALNELNEDQATDSESS